MAEFGTFGLTEAVLTDSISTKNAKNDSKLKQEEKQPPLKKNVKVPSQTIQTRLTKLETLPQIVVKH